ncbi:MAG: hypothetical protein ACREBU_14295, partial [Nitrososphaera sp.]
YAVPLGATALGIFVFTAVASVLNRRKQEAAKSNPSKIEVEVKYPDPAPVLELRPLPHYKGHSLPLQVETRELGDGKKESTATNVGASTPEYGLLEISQRFEAWKGQIDKPMSELIIKCGVIRVKCVSGDAINCKAELKSRLVRLDGQIYPSNWLEVGYCNWFSVAIKADVLQNKLDDILPAKHLGINKFLKNPTMDLHQGDERDLLLFYMTKDLPNVFLCTDVEGAHAGSIFSPGQTLQFELEIGITAQRYPRNTWRYLITISDFDDFKIEEEYVVVESNGI